MHLGPSKSLGYSLELPKKNRGIRFAVGEPGRRSTVWRSWGNPRKGDVYIASRYSAHLQKISLHETGDWRIQWVGATPDPSEIAWTSNSGRTFYSPRILDQWQRPDHRDGWTDAVSIFVPSADVQQVPGDHEPASGTRWLQDPGPRRTVHLRFYLAEPGCAPLDLSSAFVDRDTSVALVDGFRLITGETLLIFAANVPLTPAQQAKIRRARRAARRNAVDSFDLSPASGPRATVLEVEDDGHRTLWDLALA